MPSMFKPLKSASSLILVGIMATMGLAATAQILAPPVPTVPATSAAPASPGPQAGERRHDPAKMQARIAKHQAALKAALKLTPAQESAWTSYTTAAMQPPAHGVRPTPEQRAEFDKLNTPERIDKMRALRTQRMADMSAAMDKRDAATKTFYAALNPEQQKTFDAEHKKQGAQGGRGHHEGHAPRK